MNYQLELDKIIDRIRSEENGKIPRLLIHSCCAPCSSYVLEYLSDFFAITVYYYNPNIYPESEYYKRVKEQERLIKSMPLKNPVLFVEGEYEPQKYYDLVKGHENDPEGGDRCAICYRMRLEEAAKTARQGGYDYFTTTLTVSPYKNAEKLNKIGSEAAEIYGVRFLPSDFKKRNGYKRSIELSGEYGLYRQDYCGCVFSQRGRSRKNKKLDGQNEADNTTV
ncbi:MAG: epoxyqueuosine reductase QueH [Clostridiales bacterium]|jgi:predicted adenine nucleotide alpha hydrolase (AANH) superfamily ATPase|nr:epoxyqueuosine reductase QueH [Clostridiales bacterium]